MVGGDYHHHADHGALLPLISPVIITALIAITMVTMIAVTPMPPMIVTIMIMATMTTTAAISAGRPDPAAAAAADHHHHRDHRHDRHGTHRCCDLSLMLPITRPVVTMADSHSCAGPLEVSYTTSGYPNVYPLATLPA